MFNILVKYFVKIFSFHLPHIHKHHSHGIYIYILQAIYIYYTIL